MKYLQMIFCFCLHCPSKTPQTFRDLPSRRTWLIQIPIHTRYVPGRSLYPPVNGCTLPWSAAAARAITNQPIIEAAETQQYAWKELQHDIFNQMMQETRPDQDR
eukprot:scaffold909_cov123-Skeletonema_dohrnii-CCMP3373.AAC.3